MSWYLSPTRVKSFATYLEVEECNLVDQKPSNFLDLRSRATRLKLRIRWPHQWQ